MNNGNGYRVAFWVMATIATGGMIILGTGMVSNDRLRASEDQRIENTLSVQFSTIKDLTNTKLDTILQRLTRIETKIERIR